MADASRSARADRASENGAYLPIRILPGQASQRGRQERTTLSTLGSSGWDSNNQLVESQHGRLTVRSSTVRPEWLIFGAEPLRKTALPERTPAVLPPTP